MCASMYAVIRTGGKQYRVSKDDVITVEKLEGDVGSSVTLGEVLMAGEGGDARIGSALNDAAVTAEIIEHRLAEKVLVFKKRRRHNYRRKRGHRQAQTVLRVTDIRIG
jgi:large subunit ribosomal protein L21